MGTESLKTTVESENYHSPYPERFESYSQWQKLLWVLENHYQLAKHITNLYLDSYGIYQTEPNISDYTTSTTDLPSEGSSTDILGAQNNVGITISDNESRLELEYRWYLKLKEAITPSGLRKTIASIVSFYLVRNNLHTHIASFSRCSKSIGTIEALSKVIDVYIFEWNIPRPKTVNGFIFYPGKIPFMTFDVLVVLNKDIYKLVNETEVAKFIAEQLQALKEAKLTPTLSLNSVIVTKKIQSL